ncbi:MAG: hypothetical protein Q4C36_01320 [Coriobacteriia bacterium]|nr:hypothetical protein [Coriobacteriia bacterium]
MMKEEFILTRLRDERAMYRVLFIVCVVAVLSAAALAVAMLVSGAIGEALYVIGLGAGIGLAGIGSYASSKSLSRALDEVEADVEGLAFIEDYSVPTATVIEKLLLPAKTYFQLVVAYGASAAMMVVGGILIVVLVEGEKVLVALGLLLLLGGLLVGVLAIKSFRNWKAAKLFEQQVTAA